MLSFIGFIALLIFGKFLWDTYVTGKTKQDWDRYSRNNPESAARLERNNLLDFATHSESNQVHRNVSIKALAEYHQCSIDNVKDIFIQSIVELKVSVNAAQKYIKTLRQNTYAESSKLNFDPADTPSAIKAEWMKEYLDDKLYTKRWIKKDDMFEDIFAINPEFKQVYCSEDRNMIIEFGNNNTEFMMYIIEQANRFAMNAQRYLNEAEEALSSKEYTLATDLANKGLDIEESSIMPYLLRVRALCYSNSRDYDLAIKDIDNALSMLTNINASKDDIELFEESKRKINIKSALSLFFKKTYTNSITTKEEGVEGDDNDYI
ncbi:tetratricopeptide (TPR) repeat protein [Hymenobacter luteus]|uniref:Tetratricopeptide (TPR) repeat protein n=2 Tax=Hymenobacter TaxID=89966 RepID=A0A7W9SZ42_9BACT|nr:MULTISPECIES: hypothetical protein [Hymenobacter]MBB4601387.1 tetratricopeptide (TPR) repeat protein [Hymenobacter latericoloratus]MBB6058406.1 tetratricopeptide (TPR) repeat protein [Hymenobacter luteus]